jgi:hypothetical protein
MVRAFMPWLWRDKAVGLAAERTLAAIVVEQKNVIEELVAALSAARAHIIIAREAITYPPARHQDDRLLANIASALRAAGEPT